MDVSQIRFRVREFTAGKSTRQNRSSFCSGGVRELADPHWTGPEPEPEARPSLTLSTLTLCPPGRAHCSTCVRAQVALPCRVLPRNIVLDFLELSSNRHWEVRVRGRRRATAETWKWQLSYECFEAEGGRDVLVSVSSSVFQEPVSVAYTVEDSERGPVFNVTLDGPARALVVSVLPGPVLKARLCYQHFIVCDDLSPPVTGLIVAPTAVRFLPPACRANRVSSVCRTPAPTPVPGSSAQERGEPGVSVPLLTLCVSQVDPSEALTARLSFPLLLPCLCVEVRVRLPQLSERCGDTGHREKGEIVLPVEAPLAERQFIHRTSQGSTNHTLHCMTALTGAGAVCLSACAHLFLQVYHLGYDHWRRIACPLKDQRWDTRADDLWRSSTIHFLSQRSGSTLTLRWDSPCPLPHSSASLCWRDSETAPSACRVIVNSTLKREDSVYTISGVDRHPQLCVQLSYQDSYHVECPFGPGDADWTAEVTPAGSLQHLRITSGVPASFSAGLCRREEERCVPVAPVHRASLDSGSNATELRVTLSSPGPWLCVQVWRTDVAFSPKMLLCPYNPNGRLGLMALAALILSFSTTLLLFLGYLGIRKRLSGPVWQHKPVLLVSSSDSEPQVSAVCALASLLQRELCCEVQLSHWAQGELAQLGPVPWLYGQREAVRRAEGRVLIAWSPEGREVYQRWRGVLQAALACLLSEQGGGGDGGGEFALVSFTGLCHSRDIPQRLSGLPHYRLPRDFGRLVEELQGGRGGCRRCWARLLTKTLAHRLACQLAAWLWSPWRQEEGHRRGKGHHGHRKGKRRSSSR
ncbi:I17RE protein, partial [Atractosteus spatula]|nr:I17RE protein [Atractosteus spatula]